MDAGEEKSKNSNRLTTSMFTYPCCTSLVKGATQNSGKRSSNPDKIRQDNLALIAEWLTSLSDTVAF
jgi:hypothetical protein